MISFTEIPDFNYLMESSIEVKLSDSLCEYIYSKRNGFYETHGIDYYSCDWNSKEGVKNYLGTYWPKTFSESFVFFYSYFSKIDKKNFLMFNNKLRIIDLGSNSLPATAGFLEALRKSFDTIKSPIEVVAVDKNKIALEEGKLLLETFFKDFNLKIQLVNTRIENFKIEKIGKFDIILASKVGCEIFESGNLDSYKNLIKIAKNILEENGIFYLAEITRQPENDTSNFFPELINRQINSYIQQDSCLLPVFPIPCGFYARECRKKNCFIQAVIRIYVPKINEIIPAKVFYKLFMLEKMAEKFLEKYANKYTKYPIKFVKGKDYYCELQSEGGF